MAPPSFSFPCAPSHNSTIRLYHLETQRMPTEPLPIDTFGYDPEDPQLFVRISKRFVYKKQTGSGPSQLYDSPTPPNVDQLALYGDPLAKTSKLVYTGPDDKHVPLLNPGEVPFSTIATTGLVLEPPAKEHPVRTPPTPPRTPDVAQEVTEEGAAHRIREMGSTPYPGQLFDSGPEGAELVYPECRSPKTAPDPRKECTPQPFSPRPRTVDCGEPSKPAPGTRFRRECTPYPHAHPYPYLQRNPTQSEPGPVRQTKTRYTRTNPRPRPPPFNGERPPFVFPPRSIDHGEPGLPGSDSRIQTAAAQPTTERERTPYDQDLALALTYPYPHPDPEQHRPSGSYTRPEETNLGLNYTYYSVGDSEPHGLPIPTSVAPAAQIDAPEAPPPIIIVIPVKAPRSTPLPTTRTQQVMDCVYRLVELLGSGGDGNHDPVYEHEKEREAQTQTQKGKGKRKRSEDEDHDGDEYHPLEHGREAEAQALVPFSQSLLGRPQMEAERRPQCACCVLPNHSDDDRLTKRARIEDWLSCTY